MSIQIVANQIKDSAVTSAKLAGSIPSSKLDLTGTFNYGSGTLQAASPTNNSDVATKSYVDGLVSSGTEWKSPARVATTANITLTSPGTAIDGITLSNGDRVVVKDQSTQSQNGIYIFNGSGASMTRATDADTAGELNGAAILVLEGSTNADQQYAQNAEIQNLGSDAVTFVQMSGTGQIEAGSALSKTGNRLDVEVDDSTIEVASDALRIKDSGVTNAKLAGSISQDKLAGSIPDSKLNQITTANKVAGSALQISGSGGLENSGGIGIAASGVTAAMLAGSIPNAKLVNDTIAIGGVALSLGDTDATPAFDLSDATNYPTSSLTGTITNAQLAGSIADSKLNQITTSAKVAGSAVQLASGSGLEDATGLKISAGGVTDSMLAGSIGQDKLAGSIPDSKLNQITTSAKVAGSAVQLAVSGGLTNATGLKIDAGGVTAAMMAGSVPDSKLNQITTANKVAGSSIQLGSGSGLEDATGLKISNNGVTAAMLNGSIPDSKLSTITSSNKVSGSAVQISGSGGLEDSSGLGIAAGAVTNAMLDGSIATNKLLLSTEIASFSPDGNAVNFDLDQPLTNNTIAVLCFRNGILVEQVASNPSGVDQFSVSLTGGAGGNGRLTFGTAPAGTDNLRCFFIY